MKYMGSKNRIAKHIIPIMLEQMKKDGRDVWLEPFVGGGNVIDKVPVEYTRIGCDVNPHAIAALTAIRDYADNLPEVVTEDQYKDMKRLPAEPISSWVRFVCSFGGKFDAGYARENNSCAAALKRGAVRNFAKESKENAQKQSPHLMDVALYTTSYETLTPRNSLVYCDPPYQGTTGYKTEQFNHKHFFQWCRTMKSLGNTVFVSEYTAPEDFTCVWQGEVKTNFSSTRSGATHKAVEKLFLV